jgi:hypothetical protein
VAECPGWSRRHSERAEPPGNRAIHLYNADGLGAVLYSYLQQTVLNFRDFLVHVHGKDLAESITWDLLPLGATTPSEAVQFMRVDPDSRTVPAINDFLEEPRKGIESVDQRTEFGQRSRRIGR